MARYLFIVSRPHSALYEYLLGRFAGDKNVQVILDRRLGERRQQEFPVGLERRRAQRRSRPEIDAELASSSHMIVTIP